MVWGQYRPWKAWTMETKKGDRARRSFFPRARIRYSCRLFWPGARGPAYVRKRCSERRAFGRRSVEFFSIFRLQLNRWFRKTLISSTFLSKKRASENPRKNEGLEKVSIWKGNFRYFWVLDFGHRKSLKIFEDFPSRWSGCPSKRASSERPTFIEDFASRARRPAGHRKDYKTAGFLSEAPFGRRILVFFHKFRKKAPRKKYRLRKMY